MSGRASLTSFSEEFAYTAGRKYARIIQKLGFEVTFNAFTIQNMVGRLGLTLSPQAYIYQL